jgi:amino acid adenylation domain-containing protein
MRESAVGPARENVASTAADLLSALRARDVRIWVEGDRLRLSAPKDALTAELQADLARHKAEILAYLRAASDGRDVPSLTRVARDGDLALSFAQERMWFLQQMDPASVAYNLQANVPLPADLDLPALERALTELVRRHEVLRTTFAARDGLPVQVIAAPSPIALPVSDLTTLAPAERVREAERLAGEDVRRPFDLELGPLFRMRLLRMGDEGHQLLVTQHHVVTDGWSIALLVEEVLVLYRAFSSRERHALPEPELQYADFAHWQRQWLRGEALDSRLAYWRERLRGAPPAIELPTDRPRPAVQTVNGARLHFQLPDELSRRVHALSRTEGVTPFMTLLAVFQVLLGRYAGQDDVVVGTANGNRGTVETERMLGLFVNMLVLRTDVSGDPTFRELLSRVRTVVLGAVAHGDLPFEKLVEDLAPPRDLARSAIFQVLFVIQNTPLEALSRSSPGARGVIGEGGTAAYELSLYFIDTGQGFRGSLEYNTDLFDEATIGRLRDHYETLLAAAVAHPEARLSTLPLLPEAERRRIVVEWNSTARPVRPQPVHERFADQAARTPDAIAVSFEGQDLSYRDLDARSNRLAHRLRRLGVGPEALVAVALERSVDMVVALLGVLKAGGAYVPLDPGYPAGRLAYMLDDAKVRLLLTQESLRPTLPGSAEVLCVDADPLSAESAEAPGVAVDPDHLAYLIYTSGSTGRPKGVQVPHGALSNFLATMGDTPGLKPADHLLSVTTLSFDIAGLELYLPLVTGARVEIVSAETAADGARLLERLLVSGATVMQATPATWRLLLEAGWAGGSIKVLCGGEALPGDLADELRRRGASLWSLYGPTETTIWSAVHRVEGTDGIAPIGTPIANTRLYVLDPNMQPAPVGVSGELYIGGAGVARGYRNRPDLTAERFVPDPFGPETGERLYRTGDLTRWRPDGVVEFLGRTDHQVKVRGFRIELPEIEGSLLGLPAVKAAAVLPRENGSGDVQLVAYVVFGPGSEPTVTEMRAALRERLPGYMIPSSFVILDDLPLTPNGKLDRKALSLLDARSTAGAAPYVEPRTSMERLVAAIWMEALGLSRVSVHDNFFDLGGHSLLSMRVLARVDKAVGLRLNPRELTFQTLEQFAATCEKRSPSGGGAA